MVIMKDGKKIVLRVESDEELDEVYCTTYQIRDMQIQFHDLFITAIDFMNFILHYHLLKYMKPGITVVEFCMGRGLLPKLLKYNYKKIGKYIGIDINPKAIREAKTKFGYKRIGNYKEFYPFPVEFIEGDVAEASKLVGENVADVLIYVSSLEHMRKEVGVKSLQEAYKVLKDTGVMILSTPNASKHKKRYK
ncbi:MAG TPA: methyltransferase domain-containing protein, partial [Candidatus Bathyarchaeota archaeon]|nr:methyltransferase domain-containing protein [Candidatus Bathyarchaeota archaeon]